MKKKLLFILVFSLFLGAFAQEKAELNYVKKIQDSYDVTPSKKINAPDFVLNQSKAINEDVNRVYVGKAGSQRSVRRDENHVISYNSELDVISITFILDPELYPQADEMGVIGQFYSTDRGETWQGPVVVREKPEEDGVENYYPSGIIYNPSGNSDLSSAYAVSQSTILPNPSSDPWNSKAFGSNKISGDDYNDYLFEEVGYDGYWNQFGFNQIGDEVRGLNMVPEGDWAAFTSIALQPYSADFDNGAFEWNFSTPEELDLWIDGDGEAYWIGKWVGRDGATEIAWSDDGQIGYMWILGITAEEGTCSQPVLFKTEDAGDSWDEVEVDFFTDEAQQFFDPYLFTIHTGMMIPYVYESAGVVDFKGDLQMFMLARSCSADAINYSDSVGFIYNNDYGHIFNITFDGNGVKEMMWVDSILTDNPGQDPPNYAGNTGWQHRICASKSVDEEQVFVTWIDSREEIEENWNLEPDVFGWSKCALQNIHTDPICFTEGTLYEKFYFFTYAADRAFKSEDGLTYTLPYMQTVTPGEYTSNTNASGDPVTISYVTGIEFPVLDCPIGINGIEANLSFEVSQNNPNPFSTITTVDISSSRVDKVSIEVSNLMGQSIYTIDAGVINGNMKVNIPAKDLKTGVYFYTVTIGNESVTKKMIVE